MKIDSVATRQHTTNERRGTRDGRYSEGIRSWVGIGALWGGVAGLLFAPGALVTPALALAGLSGPVCALRHLAVVYGHPDTGGACGAADRWVSVSFSPTAIGLPATIDAAIANIRTILLWGVSQYSAV